MNNTTVSTSAASAGAAGAFVVVLQWLLGLGHVTLPTDVGVAIGVLGTWAVHTATIHGWTMGMRTKSAPSPSASAADAPKATP